MTATDFQDGTSVLVVTLTPPDGQCSVSFTESLLRAVMYDVQKGQILVRGGGPAFFPSSPNNIALMRNQATKVLLDEMPDVEWMLFIDSDMGFDEDAPYRLLEAADPLTRPVIGALCFGMFKAENDLRGGWRTKPFPTLYDWRGKDQSEDGTSGFVLRYDFTPNSVTQVAATGGAFLLIHRSVLEAVRESSGDTWFDRAKMSPEEDLMGEDISFCARLGALKIPVFVHTGVGTTHLKPVWVDESYFQGQRALAALKAIEDE